MTLWIYEHSKMLDEGVELKVEVGSDCCEGASKVWAYGTLASQD